MIVINKNEGTKIAYATSGNVISFRDGELSLDLEKYQRNSEVNIDICITTDDLLTAGMLANAYVAQIKIPAKVEGETFSMDNVELTLWALEA